MNEILEKLSKNLDELLKIADEVLKVVKNKDGE